MIFATVNTTTGLLRVAVAGGEPKVLTTPDRERGEVDDLWQMAVAMLARAP